MYMKAFLVSVFALFLSCVSLAGGDDTILGTKWLSLTIGRDGLVKSVSDKANGTNYLMKTPSSPFATITMWKDVKNYRCVSVVPKGDDDLALEFANGVKAVVGTKASESHITLELKSISDKDVKYFVWGPYHLTIDESVGDVLGLVENDKFSIRIGTASLNTGGGLGGDAVNCGTPGQGKAAVRLSELNKKNKKTKGKRGTRLAAYAKDRTRPDVVSLKGTKKIAAHPVPGVGVVGSKITIVGGPPDKLMDNMEKMVLAEKLPHPTYKGLWVKKTKIQAQPKIICPFSEKDVDEYIAIAKTGGFKTLHVKIPYETKGTFKPKKSLYPNGWKSVRACADKIKAAGLIPSFHNLSGFIDFADPLATPKPAKGLTEAGVTKLAKDISATDTTIVLDSSTPLDAYVPPPPKKGKNDAQKQPRKKRRRKSSSPTVIRIGDELILYGKPSSTTPLTFEKCVRGFNGTKAVEHSKNDKVARLPTHKRKDFYPSIEMIPLVAKNLAKTCLEGGIENISFDGLESANESGQAPYAQALFTQTIWDQLKKNDIDTFFSSSSGLSSYYWFLCSQQSWGEPHAAGFRHEKNYYELKIPKRINNALKPNHVAFRLGQYQFSKLSSITDIEWLMTKCAALGGTFDLYMTLDDFKRSGDFGKKVMETIALWVDAMNAGAVPEKIKKDMEIFETVYRLTKTGGEFKFTKLPPEEAKEVVKPVLGKREKSKRDKEKFH